MNCAFYCQVIFSSVFSYFVPPYFLLKVNKGRKARLLYSFPFCNSHKIRQCKLGLYCKHFMKEPL